MNNPAEKMAAWFQFHEIEPSDVHHCERTAKTQLFNNDAGFKDSFLAGADVIAV
jgi:hypothetical protein